jgi:DNA/RNA-binding domain of Phe-tRNA-synthetase-like protein
LYSGPVYLIEGRQSVFNVTKSWQDTHPGAAVGVLVMRNVDNPKHHPALEAHKTRLERDLVERYGNSSRAELRSLPVLQAYHTYYKQFKKTYHIQLQLESVALKGKSIPSVAALVETMFVAELENLLLTAGHDLDLIEGPLELDSATGEEVYTCINGQEKQLTTGDMFIRDARGVISSIIYGPDSRTRIRPETRNVVFTTYAPPGVENEAVLKHNQDIRDLVFLVAPNAAVEMLEVFCNSG